jgi:hypothetical protein
MIASNQHGKAVKQSLLLDSFVAPVETTAAATTASSHVPPAAVSLPAAPASATSRRRSSRNETAQPVTVPSPRKRRSATAAGSTEMIDLAEDTPMITAESGAESEEKRTDRRRSPTHSAVVSSTSRSHTPVPTNSLLSTAAPSSTSALDPWQALIARYESVHGPRKRWKRKWGVDESLYPKQETIEIDGDESQEQTGADANQQQSDGSAHSGVTDTTAMMDIERETEAKAAKPSSAVESASDARKPVFLLFQNPKGKRERHPAASRTNGAEQPVQTDAPPATSTPSAPRAAHSTSGIVRVSTAICSRCRAVCKGSFPLGASVLCRSCQPNWTQIAQKHMTQQPPQVVSPPLPVVPSNTSPPPPNGLAPALPAASLTPEQRAIIEAKKLAALARLKEKKCGNANADSKDVETSTSVEVKADSKMTDSAAAE